MQIVLEDAQYRQLMAESRVSGSSIGGLVRQAIDARYATTRAGLNVAGILADTAGCWSRAGDGEAYVDALRTGSRWSRDG